MVTTPEMDTHGSVAISKVTVEYHDPSGVFPLLAQQLQSRLPLRNLHWKSSTRPLRSIDSLHVDLVKSQEISNLPSEPGSRPSSGYLQSGRSTSPTAVSTQPPVKERRHQVPGLRQTPYLKLYLLRCDDSDSYKSNCRKAVREWVKAHTPPSQSSSSKNTQDNHDAFEWMIVHVVVPRTVAASQPRSSASNSRNEGGGSEKTSKFLSRSSTTLLEKLRSDFNHSSKTAPDRVAQIRLRSEEVPQSFLQTASGLAISDYNESPQERAESWDELVSKLKSLILSSFDLRVSQYEDDIKERDSQRSLPGWNFCTFFVLKEGLARGFESVGLVDDALAGYDELLVGLESVLQSEDDGAPTHSFLPFTDEISILAEEYQNHSSFPSSMFWGAENPPISTSKKNYRELILANNISVFEFKCYIFARQMAILLRMGGPTQSEKSESEDLVALAQLCHRGSIFLASASRLLRDELVRSSEGAAADAPDAAVIDSIVASWSFAVVQQLLEQTKSSALTQSTSAVPKISLILKDKSSTFPTRRSSLAVNNPFEKPQDDSQALLDNLKSRSDLALDGGQQNRSGKDHLAAHRAELFLLQRQIVWSIASRHNWKVGYAGIHDGTHGDLPKKLSDVDLSDEEKPDSEAPTNEELEDRKSSNESVVAICQQNLREAASSIETLRGTYENLTKLALDHYFIAGRTKSFERMLSDLAILKFQTGDYAGAANYFAKVAPIYSQHQWSLIETEMLLMHAACLKKLNRRDDYVRMLLNLVAKAVSRKSSLQHKHFIATEDAFDIESHQIDGHGILSELLTYSAQLPYEVPVKMSTFFTNITVDPYIRHQNDRDGFQLKLKFKHLLEEELSIERVKILLAPATHEPMSDIWMESDGPFRVSPGTANVNLYARDIVLGPFTVRSITMIASKINFSHTLGPTQEPAQALQPTNTRNPSPSLKQNKNQVLCYPKVDAFDAKIAPARFMHIDKTRVLEIEIKSATDDITKAELKLRPGSSGLRLHTADATLIEGYAKLGKSGTPGVLEISGIQKHSSVKVGVPYDLEDNHREISLRLDITSMEPKLSFSSTQRVSVDLPVDVNVQDLFKASILLSRFHVRSLNGTPLNIINIKLQGTDAFSVEDPPCSATPLLILAKQPATFVYKVSKSQGKTDGPSVRKSAAEEKPLILTLDYRCIDEEISSTIIQRFVEDLSQSDFQPLSRLLISTLRDRLRDLLTPQNYTEITLTEEINLPSFDITGWSTILSDLPKLISEDLRTWLQDWHKENKTVVCHRSEWNEASSEGTSSGLLPHRIVIPVPLPRLHVLHVASLTPNSEASAVMSIGMPIPATLTIQHTRFWDSPSALKSFLKSSDAPLDFVFEIEAPSDSWLIGGQRRTRFSALEDEKLSWPVMLIPLKVGRLLLPTIDIRVLGEGTENIGCETDLKSFGDTIMVINDVTRATVTLTEGPMGADVVLVAAENTTFA